MNPQRSDPARVVPSVANSRPQVAQKHVYGLVMAVLHNGQASSNQVPSLMQYRSLDVAGTARVQHGHSR
jgi:hypothetical protein